ncbi:MAG: helix-turn-helix domain-containing protein [Halanaeroarchaeum sp.]
MIYVRFRLDHPIFRETVDAVPETTLHWVRNVPRDAGSTLLVWVDTDDVAAFREAIGADPTIARIVTEEAVDDRTLCEVELSETGSSVDLYSVLLETGSMVQEATVRAEGWDCQFGFSDREALAEFFDTARDLDIDYSIERVYEPRDADGVATGLTDAQREALVTAKEIGYFDVPRERGLEALGEELGISDSAASERLRRGISSLVDTVVTGQVDTRSRGGE